MTLPSVLETMFPTVVASKFSMMMEPAPLPDSSVMKTLSTEVALESMSAIDPEEPSAPASMPVVQSVKVISWKVATKTWSTLMAVVQPMKVRARNSNCWLERSKPMAPPRKVYLC